MLPVLAADCVFTSVLVYSFSVSLCLLCTENYEFSVVLHYRALEASALASIAETSCVTRVLLTIVLRLLLLLTVKLYWQHVHFVTIYFRFGPPPYDALVQADDVLLLPHNAVYDSILCALRLGTL